MAIPLVERGRKISADHQNLLIAQVNQNTEDVAVLVGSAGLVPFTHDQTTPAATWSGTHGLNRYPRAVVLDDNNDVLIADITYPTLDTFSITFASPTSGSAHFI